MSACRHCATPDPQLTGTEELCGYCGAAEAVRSMALRDPVLWDMAGGAYSADFWSRQGAHIVLRERGYEMPWLLPVHGDPMPPRRLRVIGGGRP